MLVCMGAQYPESRCINGCTEELFMLALFPRSWVRWLWLQSIAWISTLSITREHFRRQPDPHSEFVMSKLDWTYCPWLAAGCGVNTRRSFWRLLFSLWSRNMDELAFLFDLSIVSLNRSSWLLACIFSPQVAPFFDVRCLRWESVEV